ncbi:hypothetical protein F5Y18DRAFT_444159 [Xylariaceae sp. FL1019]|nr:hypothetical protein F5Y18DRAFT_444159 [Xylariaceae sp. FL1019]
MDLAFLQRLLTGVQASVQAVRCSETFTNAMIGFSLMLCVQLLVMPLQIILDLNSVNLPASILVMLLVVLSMTIASRVSREVSVFYENCLREPTDFLGRHMPLGFVPFFILLSREHMTAVSDVFRVASAFIVTTTMSYAGSFLFATASYGLEQRLRRFRGKASDIESNKTWPSPSIAFPAPQTQLPPKRISQLSSLSLPLSMDESITATNLVAGGPDPYTLEFALRTAPAWICLFLITTIGVPVYLGTGFILPFEVFLLVLLWTISIEFHKGMKASCFPKSLRRIQSKVVVLTNPLLLTIGLALSWEIFTTVSTTHPDEGPGKDWKVPAMIDMILRCVEEKTD